MQEPSRPVVAESNDIAVEQSRALQELLQSHAPGSPVENDKKLAAARPVLRRHLVILDPRVRLHGRRTTGAPERETSAGAAPGPGPVMERVRAADTATSGFQQYIGLLGDGE